MKQLAICALLSYLAFCSHASGQTGLAARRAQPVENFAKLPLSFEANTGQADKSVKFFSRGSGYGLYLTGEGAVLALRKSGCAGGRTSLSRSVVACQHQIALMSMRLVGASSWAPAGEEKLPGTANYFVSNNPAKWHSNVPTYAKVRYRGIYPGVDLVYYGNQRQLEYDLVVAPGGDPKSIRLRFTGVKGLRLSADGDLVLTVLGGVMAFHKPVVYQEVNGQRRAVVGGFALLTRETVGFQLESYDHERPLVIDPVLAYSTYLGGSGLDEGNAIAVDASGNVYVAGSTQSTDFPVTAGAIQTTNRGVENYGSDSLDSNVFVTKLNSTGDALLYSTYLGGTGADSAFGLVVDGSGNAYVAGSTQSTSFPVTQGAFQTTIHGAAYGQGSHFSNAFVTKLNPTGSGLVYSTYIGGSGGLDHGDSAGALALDGSGNAYITGVTFSTDFPVTPGAFQSDLGPNSGLVFGIGKAFVTKLNPTGSALVYSTLLGGTTGPNCSTTVANSAVTGSDSGNALAIDGSGNAYIAGTACTQDFPTTAGAFQTGNKSASSDGYANAFVTKLNPTGSALIYSTYLGGSVWDGASGLAVDGSGNAYVTGSARSYDFPVTSGAFQKVNGAPAIDAGNAFVTKLNPTGSSLIYSTFIGGNFVDGASGLVVDGSGNAYLAGTALSANFPVTPGAFQTTKRGTVNAFFTKLNPTGSALIYSTFLGGSGQDYGLGLAVNGSDVYITGLTESVDFPVTSGAFQTSNHSPNSYRSGDAFVAKLDLSASQSNGQAAIITTVAGNGMPGFSGDGLAATSAELHLPSGVVTDAFGNLFIADSANNRIREVSASGIITTLAGNGTKAFSGDGGPAASASLSGPSALAVDASGSLFIADFNNNRIRKVSASGIITTVAGNGTPGFSGDGGPATAASLIGPAGVAVDASGNLFIVTNNRIRKVSASTSTITTVAGGGTEVPGDGGPATSVLFQGAYAVAVDLSGNLFVADSFRVRKVSANGIITTVAGTGVAGFSGSGPATSAELNLANGVAVDTSGNLFIADFNNNRIRQVSASGIITTVAGNGTIGFSGDGGPATSASLFGPTGVAVDMSGNIFIADFNNDRIREVSVAGSSSASFTVSPANLSFSIIAGGSSSQQLSLSGTAGVAWSASASIDWITLTPASGTVPGTMTVAIDAASLQPGSYTGSITISNPLATPEQETVSVKLTVAPAAGSVSVTPSDLNFQILQGAPAQSQSLQIGGTAGIAWQATVATPTGGAWLSVSPGSGKVPESLTALVSSAGLTAGTYQGSITIQAPEATPSLSTISVKLTVTAATGQVGIIRTVAGNGLSQMGSNCVGSGAGGPATSASLCAPNGVAVDASGNLFIADSDDGLIWKVSTSGIINVVAGGGIPADGVGDNGPATSAALNGPIGVAVDASGNLFIADTRNARIRKVSVNRIITTVAGNGAGAPEFGGAFSGDGGPATSASLNYPEGIAVDASGNLFIADVNNERIRKVSASGIITTVAGNPSQCPIPAAATFCGGFSGDGGPATSAQLNYPDGVAVDASGNLFIADQDNNRVRKVSASGIITTIAGNGPSCSNPFCGGYSGDGGPATSAQLNTPSGVAVDASGNLFLADLGNSRIRKVSASGTITTVAGNGIQGFSGDGGPAASASLNHAFGVTVDGSGNLFVVDTGNGRIREVSASSKMTGAVNVTAVGNGASFTQSFAPGMLMSVFGTGLSTGSPQTVVTAPLPVTSLSGTSVSINGILAPLLYISATQINLQIPYEVSAGAAVLTVIAGAQSASISFTIGAAGPGIFVDSQNGHIVPSESAAAGSTIGFYLTGAGQVTPSEATGSVPAAGTTPVPNLPLTMTVGGVPVTPVYVGIPHWSVGVLQINFTVPSTLAAGTQPVVVTIGGVASNAALISVTPP